MLKVDGATCKINKAHIVRDMTFTVRPGEIVALLGANGAGKSTLMRMMCGERFPNAGSISLYGKKLQAYSAEELARKRAYLSQYNVVNMPFTAREIVTMGRYVHYKNFPSTKDTDIINEVMKLCGVYNFAERSILTLSGGEQQRVQLARVLAQLWDVPGGLLLLDEPVAGMDLLYQQQTLAIAKAMARKGYIVVCVLHEINLAAQYADRLLMMKNGRRWCDGTPSETLNTLNIYSVFSIETDILVDPQTLNPYMIPREMKRMESFTF
jgi:iron complex transport system ATP-binding protein